MSLVTALLRQEVIQAAQDVLLAGVETLLELGAVEEPLTLAGRHIAHPAEGVHHLLLLHRTQLVVFGKDGTQLPPLFGREALHDLLPLPQHLLLMRRQIVPTLQVLADLLLPPRGQVVKLSVVAQDSILLLGRQFTQVAEEAGGVLMLILPDAPLPPCLLLARRPRNSRRSCLHAPRPRARRRKQEQNGERRDSPKGEKGLAPLSRLSRLSRPNRLTRRLPVVIPKAHRS